MAERALPRMRTIPWIVNKIRESDPETAITYYRLSKMARDGNVRASTIGNLTLIDYDDLMDKLGFSCGEEVTS